MRRSTFLAPCAAVTLLVCGVAHAETEPPVGTGWEPGHRTTSRLPNEIDADSASAATGGVYGRFDGLYDVSLEMGGAFDENTPSAAFLGSVHYMFMAGVYTEYEDAFGGGATSARTVSFGVDVRPAFIPRWSNNLEVGSSVVDLVIDSISLGAGAYFREPPRRPFGDRRGLEMSLGFGVPLLGKVEGPWFGARGLLRWDDPGSASAPSAEILGVATIGFHFMVGGG
jgi:hypothetical protein